MLHVFRSPHRVLLLGLLLLPSLAGCDSARIAARSSARIARRAAPGVEQFWDWELAGDAMPSTIMQLEAMCRVDPDNDELVLRLARTYVGYAYGWVEDRADQLELDGNYTGGDEQRRRAKYMYLRAKDLGLYLVRDREDGLDRAMSQGEAALERWLAQSFDDVDDAPLLFWTGSAWASYIGASRDDMSAAADLPYARAFVRRSVALDPEYQNYAGTATLGAIEASIADGDLAESKRLFDEALLHTQRQALPVLVNMANTYAVQTQDRALYVSLLREALEAGDVLPQARLMNRVAKRRAARYLRQVDTRFPQ